MAHGYPQLGNLYSKEQEEIEKTVACIYILIRQRQLDLDFRHKHNEIVRKQKIIINKIQKLKNELMIIQKKYDLSQHDKEKLQKELGKMENNILTLKEQLQKHTEVKKNEKTDFKQITLKMEQRFAQLSHDMRKKDALATKLQEQIRKVTKESTLGYKNDYELSAKLEAAAGVSGSGAEIIGKGIETSEGYKELAGMLKDGYESCQKKLLSECSRLKECLELLQKEMEGILNSAIASLKGKVSGQEERYELKCLEPIQIKPIVFQMPMEGVK